MGKITHRYRDETIQVYGSEIVDPESGEIISCKNSTLIKRTSTDEITINSKEYIYLDTETLKNLLKIGIKDVDLALLLKLASNLLINYNVCLDVNDEPFKTASIAKLIKNTTQATNRKLNRLIKFQLLYHGQLHKKKRLGKVYILNPYLIRKGRKLSAELSYLFDDKIVNPKHNPIEQNNSKKPKK